ncbi:MAG: Holliday junction resolvase RuvX [Clostridia bacterium]|jgi:putative Holliday junction resolvase|nr:Holliday junction resolvase RuvX [Clostridia bacterium]
MRILGLDFGSKTIGVAVSDELGFTAQGIEVVRRKNEIDVKESIERIIEIIEEYNVEKIVLGMPKNMNNTLGDRAEKTLWFKKLLYKKVKMEIILWDERLSTCAAERYLISADVSRMKRRKVIDKMAAVFILQGYLESLR